MKSDFFRCGMYGWCLEILWTGLHSLTSHDRKLTGVSSLHMFPIYGTAAFFRPLACRLSKYPPLTRGFVYMCCIYAVEYLSGSYLKSGAAVPGTTAAPAVTSTASYAWIMRLCGFSPACSMKEPFSLPADELFQMLQHLDHFFKVALLFRSCASEFNHGSGADRHSQKVQQAFGVRDIVSVKNFYLGGTSFPLPWKTPLPVLHAGRMDS